MAAGSEEPSLRSRAGTVAVAPPSGGACACRCAGRRERPSSVRCRSRHGVPRMSRRWSQARPVARPGSRGLRGPRRRRPSTGPGRAPTPRRGLRVRQRASDTALWRGFLVPGVDRVTTSLMHRGSPDQASVGRLFWRARDRGSRCDRPRRDHRPFRPAGYLVGNACSEPGVAHRVVRDATRFGSGSVAAPRPDADGPDAAPAHVLSIGGALLAPGSAAGIWSVSQRSRRPLCPAGRFPSR